MAYQSASDKCVVCRKKGVDIHHIASRGSGGSDKPHNLIFLCREHHSIVHNMGTYTFSMTFVGFGTWLFKKGWSLDKYYKKWRHDNEGEAV